MPVALYLAASLLCSAPALQAESGRLVRTTAEVRALSGTACPTGIPVAISGQVTAEPYKKGIILTDATGGCYIENLQNVPGRKPRCGDLISVCGETFANEFHQEAVRATNIAFCGHAPLPAPRQSTVERILSGKDNFRTVRVSGFITEVIRDEINPEWHYMVLKDNGVPVYVAVPEAGESETLVQKLIDCEVELTGVVMPHYCAERLFIGPHLELWSKDEIKIRTAASGKFESYPYLEDILHVNPAEISKMRRRRAEGTITAVWNGNRALLEEDSGRRILIGLSQETTAPRVGSRVVVVGFPETDLFRLSLSRSLYRVLPRPPEESDSRIATPVKPADILFDENGNRRLSQEFFGRLIRLHGIVRSVPTDSDVTQRMFIDSDGFLVPVDLHSVPRDEQGLCLGCKLEISGICIMEAESWRTNNLFPVLGSFTLVPQSANDIRVLSRPSWWTPARLLVVIGSLFLALVAFVVWNRILNRLVERRSQQLFREQVAHAGSDLKVDERTRLAVELHDSLSQTLTGVSFQIDAAEKARQRDPSRIEKHLAIAKRTLQSCRDELRNCLWDLRNNALEDADTATAVRRTIEPHIGEAQLALDVQVPRAKLSDNTFHSILCILRELSVNAVRHGAARQVTIAGRLADGALTFSVTDDGSGFDPDNRPGMDEGHFGLQGIAERLDTLGGEMDIASRHGRGTSVTVRIRI